MAELKSVTKYTSKDGGQVIFTDFTEQYKYSIKQLTMRALKDVGITLRGMMRDAVINDNHSRPGTSKLLNKGRNRLHNVYTYWYRKREGDLLVGIKDMAGNPSGHSGKASKYYRTDNKQEYDSAWYAMGYEIGTNGLPRRAYFQTTVNENMDVIQKIVSTYLKKLNGDDIYAQVQMYDDSEGNEETDETHG